MIFSWQKPELIVSGSDNIAEANIKYIFFNLQRATQMNTYIKIQCLYHVYYDL